MNDKLPFWTPINEQLLLPDGRQAVPWPPVPFFQANFIPVITRDPVMLHSANEPRMEVR